MRGGIWVLTIFAALWGVAAILMQPWPAWLAVVPVAISAALLGWAIRQPVGTGGAATGGHVGRVVGIASCIEGVAIFVTCNILIQTHQPTAVLPAIAIIVGLHFVPLARWIPMPLYYRTAAALVVVGAGVLLLPPPWRGAATGIAAALVLWESAVALTLRGRG